MNLFRKGNLQNVTLNFSLRYHSRNFYFFDISPHTTPLNTKPDVIARLNRDGIERLLERLLEDRKLVKKDMVDELKRTIDNFQEIEFVLPVPASSELCQHVAKGLRMAFGEISEGCRIKSEPLKNRIEQIVSLRCQLEEIGVPC